METLTRTAWLILLDLPSHMTTPHPEYEPEYDTFTIPETLTHSAVKALCDEGILKLHSESANIITVQYRDSNADSLSVCFDWAENSVSIHYL